MRGPVGEAGIPGTKGDQGDRIIRCSYVSGNIRVLKDQLVQKETREILGQEDLREIWDIKD